jgi:hypothetical protein
MRQSISGWLSVRAALVITFLATPARRARDERGDVPGWVMVTVMTATIIAVLLPFVREELKVLLQHAFSIVRQ